MLYHLPPFFIGHLVWFKWRDEKISYKMILVAVVAVPNPKRVGNRGLFFLPDVLIVIGVALIVWSKNRKI